ncbi:hypothetical protein [Synechococcus sp. BS55D]|uniref:hypothetical protein n=1 Tax=Synechococcus sp. BS55D TaxID=2055943 RepID=UPI001038DD84|nr:hypothetical protein [Synechococcus sp. BS55D]
MGWITTTLWLNYLAIRHAAKRIAPETQPVWISIAALVTSFSPVITQQLGHPQLLSLFLIGPILWLCHRLIQEPPVDFTISDWLLLGSWLLANGFFNIYIFVYACYGVLIASAIHLSKRFHQHRFRLKHGQRLWVHTTLLLACIGLNVTIYLPYLQTLKTFGKRDIGEIINNLPKIASWLFGSDQWLLQPPLTAANTNPDWVYGAEQELFPGWSLLILFAAVLLTAIAQRKASPNPLRIWLIAIGAMVILSLSFKGFSLWIIISKLLPGASSLRASSRVAMVIVLYAAPAIALAAGYWQRRGIQRWQPIAALLALIGSFVGIWPKGQPSFSLTAWQQENNAISAALSTSDCDLFWHEWSDQPPWRGQVMAMHAQRRTGIPTLNGYSGHFPKTDWPYAEPSGIGAYSWLALSKPEQHHRLKPAHGKEKTRCIVNYDTSLQEARIRTIKDHQGIPSELETRSEPNQIIYAATGIEAGKDLNQRLYVRSKPRDGDWSAWTLLIRDGQPIPAERGDYQITHIAKRGNRLEITDSNSKEGMSYIWIVDKKTGVFVSQIPKAIKKL